MISVVTPAFNAEKYIGQAIESVQSQGLDVWEMIVVDDGSNDRTRAIIRSYAEKDARVRLIECHHGGVSQARNVGLSAARYEWIALLDADDVFLPGKLKKQLEAAAREPDVVLWGTYAYNIGEQGAIYDVVRDGPASRVAFEKLRRTGDVIMLKNSSTLFRRTFALELNGFDSRFDSAEDTDLWNRMAEHGPVMVIPEPLILYRFHPQSLSVRKMEHQYACVQFIRARNRKRLQQEDLQLSEFMANYGARNPIIKWLDRCTMLSNTYWRNAGIMLSNERRLAGVYWLTRSYVANPFMITCRLARKLSTKLTSHEHLPSPLA